MFLMFIRLLLIIFCWNKWGFCNFMVMVLMLCMVACFFSVMLMGVWLRMILGFCSFVIFEFILLDILVWIQQVFICLKFVVCKLIRQLNFLMIFLKSWQIYSLFWVLLCLFGLIWLRLILLLKVFCFSNSLGIFVMSMFIIVFFSFFRFKLLMSFWMIGMLFSLLLCRVVFSLSIGLFFLFWVIMMGIWIGLLILLLMMCNYVLLICFFGKFLIFSFLI